MLGNVMDSENCIRTMNFKLIFRKWVKLWIMVLSNQKEKRADWCRGQKVKQTSSIYDNMEDNIVREGFERGLYKRLKSLMEGFFKYCDNFSLSNCHTVIPISPHLWVLNPQVCFHWFLSVPVFFSLWNIYMTDITHLFYSSTLLNLI